MRLRTLLEWLAALPVVPANIILRRGTSCVSTEELLSDQWKVGVVLEKDRPPEFTEDPIELTSQMNEMIGRRIGTADREALFELMGEPSGISDEAVAVINSSLTEAVWALRNLGTSASVEDLSQTLMEEYDGNI